MANSIIVTQAVTFHPVRYPLNWVASPEALPAWDVSRGVSPFGYWQDVTPQGMPPREGTAIDEEVTWGGKDAPTDPTVYPRIGCAAPYLLRGDEMPTIKPSQAVAGLARFIGKPSFNQKVLEVASDYALLHPAAGDTLAAWVNFARRTAFDLLLVQAINEARAEPEKALKEKREAEPFSIESVFEFASLLLPEAARDEADQRQRFDFLFRRSELLRDLPAKVSKEVQSVSFFQDSVPQTPDQAAALLFAHHWAFFEQEAEIKLSSGSFNAVCGLGAWVHYELALAFRDATDIGICAGCHQPFFRTHGKQKVCDPKRSACRMRARRNDAKNAA